MAANINSANINTSDAVTAVNYSTSSPNQTYPATNPGSSQWNQIVRGEPVPIAVVHLSSSSHSSSSPSTVMIQPPPLPAAVEEEGMQNVNVGPNNNNGKKPAWNKASNVATESGYGMVASIWPPLSGSARGLSNSSSDSSRASLDGSSSTSSVPVSQGSRTASSSSSSQNQVRNNANLNSNQIPNHAMPVHQMPVEQNRNFSASNGGLSQPPPQDPMVEATLNGPSSRDHIQRTGFVSYGGVNDQRRPQNSFQHRNNGPHPRGNGSHHLNHGVRRNQDRGNRDWNGRNFINRDGHMLPRGVPMFMHPHPSSSPPNTGRIFAPPHVRPYGIHMGFPEFSSSFYLVPTSHPNSYGGVPFIQPVSPMLLPPEVQDHQLRASIMKQIEYYFSNDNLIKDTFLRQNMDDHGWVPIKLIAGFRQVSLLTDNIQLILDALQSSAVVEVQGDKVRKRNDWMRWIMPASIQFPIRSGQGSLLAGVQNISLDQGATNNQSGAMSQEDACADGQSVG